MKCKDCRYYSLIKERDDRFKDDKNWQTIGECNKSIEVEDIIFPVLLEHIIIEGRGSLFVGENFGCIHFKQNEE